VKTLYAGLLSLFVLFYSANTSLGQDPFAYNQMSFLTEETGIGARAIGMGGAYIGVADDYSAIYWNPAGLGLIKNNEFFTSLTHTNRNINTKFLGLKDDNSQSKTALGALGYVYPYEVYRGSLVVAGGYNRVHNYSSLFGYSGFNPGPSYMGATFSSPEIPDRLTQDETVEINGNLSQLSLGCAFEAAEDVFIGVTFNYWTGEMNYNQVFQEWDLHDYYTVLPNDFDNYLNDNIIDTDIRGYDVLIGAMYCVSPQLRLGAVINTPRFITLKEDWSINENMTFDDGTIELLEDYDDFGLFEYKVQMPFVFGAGLSYSFPNGLFSGEVRYTDWSQFQYRDDFPVAGYTKGSANRNIKRTLRAVLSPKVGLELEFPNEMKFRAGFAHVPTPLIDAESEYDRKYLSLGLGFFMGGTTNIDIAYRRGWWETNSVSAFSDIIVNENHVDHRVFATLSFRF